MSCLFLAFSQLSLRRRRRLRVYLGRGRRSRSSSMPNNPPRGGSRNGKEASLPRWLQINWILPFSCCYTLIFTSEIPLLGTRLCILTEDLCYYSFPDNFPVVVTSQVPFPIFRFVRRSESAGLFQSKCLPNTAGLESSHWRSRCWYVLKREAILGKRRVQRVAEKASRQKRKLGQNKTIRLPLTYSKKHHIFQR